MNMVLEVIYGNNQNKMRREFLNYQEAARFISYNQKSLQLNLGNRLGNTIETKPKYKNELIRKVYQNELGEVRYYILKVND